MLKCILQFYLDINIYNKIFKCLKNFYCPLMNISEVIVVGRYPQEFRTLGYEFKKRGDVIVVY